jgi:hypothetical protein
MGTCNRATLSLGYIIYGLNLVALLNILREKKAAQSKSNSKSQPGNEDSEEQEIVITKKMRLNDNDESKGTSTASTSRDRESGANKLSEEDVEELKDLASEAIGGLKKELFTITVTTNHGEVEMAICYEHFLRGRCFGYCVETWGRGVDGN